MFCTVWQSSADDNDGWNENCDGHFNDNDKKIKLITIIRSVKIVRPNEEIFGDKAIYDPKLEKIKISGNVSIIQNGNILNGSELIVDLINSTSIIVGNNGKQVSVKVAK